MSSGAGVGAAACLGLAAAVLTGCFVSEGDCVRRGVEVDPCFVNARPGQTVLLRATVIGAPDEPVDWILPAAAQDAFNVLPQGNLLTLISKQNVQSSFPVQAQSQTSDSIFGGSVVGVQSASFGSAPPPFVINGGDFPPGSKHGATAVGGNLYYVAYADAGNALSAQVGVSESSNFFVKQYGLADDVLRADVSSQFLLFAGAQTTTPIIPNIAAHCAGNGYWIDAFGTGQPTYVLRRLRPGQSAPQTRTLVNILQVEFSTLGVDCEGRIYFVGILVGSATEQLFRLDAFDGALRTVRITGYSAAFIDALAVDAQGRLLAADANPDGSRAVERLLVAETPTGPEATIDPTFNVDPFLEGVGAVTSDGSGVVYAAARPGSFQLVGPPIFLRIVALNELGELVYTIGDYEYQCPDGCEPDRDNCGDDVPFTSILSLGVSAQGELRIVDDVLTDSQPAACQETIRFLLIDPQ